MSAALGSCRVQRVVEGGRESWTLIGPDRRPVDPVDRYLAWLTNVEKSPNTLRAYACDLKLFVTFSAATRNDARSSAHSVSLRTLGAAPRDAPARTRSSRRDLGTSGRRCCLIPGTSRALESTSSSMADSDDRSDTDLLEACGTLTPWVSTCESHLGG
jgi:hypothetical protein